MLVALAEEADAEIPDDTSADAEIPGHTDVLILGHTSEESPIIIESSSFNSPMFDDATTPYSFLQETSWFTTWCSSWKEKWFETIEVGFHR